ncbi:m-AAA protease-interacting protein 1, mitochondrial [Cololabis saira]|uniref:m-AAA protease-interacting protein 1, mitochondrial n=1 Tax=Cololabis saira TaxID=129043 RepID=UPI002AD45718|nr:m-AAA protease-interacting protein 1, mitochondrial [Cololabis saira]
MVVLLRACGGIRSSRQLLGESLVLARSAPARCCRPRPRCPAAPGGRFYSSQWGEEPPKQKVLVVGIPNPFIWVRKRIYYFLIRTYFDREFRIEEFTEGAQQAFSHVSRLLSQCQFEELEGLLAKDLITKLEEKCSSLPSNYKKALFADVDEIMYTTPGDVGIFYDNNGRKFVNILMRFWYLTSAQIPDDSVKGSHMFKVTIGDGETVNKRLLSAIYEFQRDFTKGVPPDWIITRVEHSELLD